MRIGEEEIYEGNKWILYNQNTVKLNKIEAQVNNYFHSFHFHIFFIYHLTYHLTRFG